MVPAGIVPQMVERRMVIDEYRLSQVGGAKPKKASRSPVLAAETHWTLNAAEEAELVEKFSVPPDERVYRPNAASGWKRRRTGEQEMATPYGPSLRSAALRSISTFVEREGWFDKEDDSGITSWLQKNKRRENSRDERRPPQQACAKIGESSKTKADEDESPAAIRLPCAVCGSEPAGDESCCEVCGCDLPPQCSKTQQLQQQQQQQQQQPFVAVADEPPQSPEASERPEYGDDDTFQAPIFTQEALAGAASSEADDEDGALLDHESPIRNRHSAGEAAPTVGGVLNPSLLGVSGEADLSTCFCAVSCFVGRRGY